jgi:hypothetical protein
LDLTNRVSGKPWPVRVSFFRGWDGTERTGWANPKGERQGETKRGRAENDQQQSVKAAKV